MTDQGGRIDVVTELELGDDDPLELGPDVRRARVMVRLHGCPLGFVTVDGPGQVTGAAVLEAGGPSLQHAAQRHRDVDGIKDLHEVPDGRQPGPDEARHGLVSVILGTRNRPDDVDRALRSLVSCSGDFEVLVVDNGSHDDATRRVVNALDDRRVQYVHVAEAGLARARNIGARQARGDVLAFTDDDVRIDRGWIEALAGAFTAEPGVGLVTGMVPAAELATDAQIYFDERVSWSRRCEPESFRLPPGRVDPLLPFRGGDLGTGANMALTRAAFQSLGGFDEALGPGTPARGGEDLDLFARALLAGWVIRYEPAAIVWHVHRRELADLKVQMRGYGSGLTAYLTKHALTRAGASRLVRGLAPGARRMGSQHRDASASALGPALVRAERVGMLQGPLLYVRGRRALSSSRS